MDTDTFNKAKFLRDEIHSLATQRDRASARWDELTKEILGDARHDALVIKASGQLKDAVLVCIAAKQDALEAEFAAL